MPKPVISRSDVLEEQYTSVTGYYIGGAALLIVGLLLIWVASLVHPTRPAPAIFIRVGGAFGVLGGVGIMIRGYMLARNAGELPSISVPCPYCDARTEFLEKPTDDYTCEHCHRQVHYQNGVVAAVREVECTICKTSHRVSVLAKTFMCDKCNRVLRLDDPKKGVVATDSDGAGVVYDVVITEPGRNATEVAMALQSVLVCNLPEARKRLQDLPLTIVTGVPERKADAVRSRFRELGATAIARPSQDQPNG